MKHDLIKKQWKIRVHNKGAALYVRRLGELIHEVVQRQRTSFGRLGNDHSALFHRVVALVLGDLAQKKSTAQQDDRTVETSEKIHGEQRSSKQC